MFSESRRHRAASESSAGFLPVSSFPRRFFLEVLVIGIHAAPSLFTASSFYDVRLLDVFSLVELLVLVLLGGYLDDIFSSRAVATMTVLCGTGNTLFLLCFVPSVSVTVLPLASLTTWTLSLHRLSVPFLTMAVPSTLTLSPGLRSAWTLPRFAPRIHCHAPLVYSSA